MLMPQIVFSCLIFGSLYEGGVGAPPEKFFPATSDGLKQPQPSAKILDREQFFPSHPTAEDISHGEKKEFLSTVVNLDDLDKALDDILDSVLQQAEGSGSGLGMEEDRGAPEIELTEESDLTDQKFSGSVNIEVVNENSAEEDKENPSYGDFVLGTLVSDLDTEINMQASGLKDSSDELVERVETSGQSDNSEQVKTMKDSDIEEKKESLKMDPLTKDDLLSLDNIFEDKVMIDVEASPTEVTESEKDVIASESDTMSSEKGAVLPKEDIKLFVDPTENEHVDEPEDIITVQDTRNDKNSKDEITLDTAKLEINIEETKQKMNTVIEITSKVDEDDDPKAVMKLAPTLELNQFVPEKVVSNEEAVQSDEGANSAVGEQDEETTSPDDIQKDVMKHISTLEVRQSVPEKVVSNEEAVQTDGGAKTTVGEQDEEETTSPDDIQKDVMKLAPTLEVHQSVPEKVVSNEEAVQTDEGTKTAVGEQEEEETTSPDDIQKDVMKLAPTLEVHQSVPERVVSNEEAVQTDEGKEVQSSFVQPYSIPRNFRLFDWRFGKKPFYQKFKFQTRHRSYPPIKADSYDLLAFIDQRNRHHLPGHIGDSSSDAIPTGTRHPEMNSSASDDQLTIPKEDIDSDIDVDSDSGLGESVEIQDSHDIYLGSNLDISGHRHLGSGTGFGDLALGVTGAVLGGLAGAALVGGSPYGYYYNRPYGYRRPYYGYRRPYYGYRRPYGSYRPYRYYRSIVGGADLDILHGSADETSLYARDIGGLTDLRLPYTLVREY